MSSSIMVGNVANIMEPNEASTAALYLKTPILTNEQLAVIKSLMTPKLHTATLSMLYPVNNGAEGMETAIESLCIDALKAIKNGATSWSYPTGASTPVWQPSRPSWPRPPSITTSSTKPSAPTSAWSWNRENRAKSIILYPHRLRNYGHQSLHRLRIDQRTDCRQKTPPPRL